MRKTPNMASKADVPGLKKVESMLLGVLSSSAHYSKPMRRCAALLLGQVYVWLDSAGEKRPTVRMPEHDKPEAYAAPILVALSMSGVRIAVHTEPAISRVPLYLDNLPDLPDQAVVNHYEAAMIAANECGFAGMAVDDVLRYQEAEVSDLHRKMRLQDSDLQEAARLIDRLLDGTTTTAERQQYAEFAQRLRKKATLAELYTCIGKGGEYEMVGAAHGAGPLNSSQFTVYRSALSGQMFVRHTTDFAQRMERLRPDEDNSNAL